MNVQTKPSPKKMYQEPKFVLYGSLTDLTSSASLGPMGDVSKGGGNKTT